MTGPLEEPRLKGYVSQTYAAYSFALRFLQIVVTTSHHRRKLQTERKNNVNTFSLTYGIIKREINRNLQR